MGNLIVALIIVAVVSAAIAKIVVEKRKGARCAGCSYCQTDASSCGCSYSSNESKG